MECFRRLLHISAWTGHRTNDAVRLHAGCYALHTPCRLLRSAQDNDSVRLHTGCYALHRTTIPSDSIIFASHYIGPTIPSDSTQVATLAGPREEGAEAGRGTPNAGSMLIEKSCDERPKTNRGGGVCLPQCNSHVPRTGQGTE